MKKKSLLLIVFGVAVLLIGLTVQRAEAQKNPANPCSGSAVPCDFDPQDGVSDSCCNLNGPESELTVDCDTDLNGTNDDVCRVPCPGPRVPCDIDPVDGFKESCCQS